MASGAATGTQRDNHDRVRAGWVAARFTIGNAIGWLAFMAVSESRGAVPFWIVPAVYVAAIAWAAGALRVSLASRIGFGLAALFGLGGPILGGGLVGYQQPPLAILPPAAIAIILVSTMAAAVGLVPLGRSVGSRAWGFGVAGFVVGAVLTSLLFSEAVLQRVTLQGEFESLLLSAPFGVLMWFPSIGGGSAVAWAMKRPTPRAR